VSDDTYQSPDSSEQVVSSAQATASPADRPDLHMPQPQHSILRDVARITLIVAAFGAVGWIIWHSWTALLPFQIGIVIAYLTLPLVNWLERRMPRWLAILIVYVGGIVMFLVAVGVIVPLLLAQITTIVNALPSIENVGMQTGHAVDAIEAYINELPDEVRDLLNESAIEAFRTARDNLASYIQGLTTLLLSSTLTLINTVTFVLGFVVVPFWLFYVMKDQRLGLQALDKMLHPAIRADFWAVWSIIDRVLSSYIRGQLLLGFVVFLAVWIGLTVLQIAGFNVQYSLLLAVIAGIMELVPFIGPILGAIPAIIVGFFDSPQTALAVAILFIVIQQVENNFLVPRVVGESVDIHPAILMVLLIALSQFGFIWIVLAAPLAAITRDIFRYAYGRLSNPPRPAGLIEDDAPLEFDNPYTTPEAFPPPTAESFANDNDGADAKQPEPRTPASDEAASTPAVSDTDKAAST
jgi:predicted PurR-regulated permease PerM